MIMIRNSPKNTQCYIEYTRGYRLALVTSVVTAGDLRLAKEASPPGYIANGIYCKSARYHPETEIPGLSRARGIEDLGASSHHKHQTAPNNASAARERDFARGRPLMAIVTQRKWYKGFITSIHCVLPGRKKLLKAGVTM
jgi:hypothetical protein